MAIIITFKPKKFTYFIGVDISRNELDFAVMEGKNLLFHKETTNTPADIQAFVAELKTLPKFTVTRAVFCMENTGIYSNHLLTTLKKFKANVVIENALHIRNSLGQLRGKYDKIDSIRIAQYAYKNREELRLWIPKRPIIEQIASLFTLRNRLVGVNVSLRTPLKEQTTFVTKGIHKNSVRLCQQSISSLKTDLHEVEKMIQELVKGDERLNYLYKIVTSVPSIGEVTALQILISTNEFKDISTSKKFACYSGVAPFKRESGKIIGKARVSPISNRKVKTLLHTCAINAIRYNEELKTYYARKIKEGKPKMAVINAVRAKLISRIFACVNGNRPFKKEYSLTKLIDVEDSVTKEVV
ncbi:transposase [Mucilaginibacter sp. UYP25]|uniref:IS110 family transposase n=1 Tax=unclassified Mucilaginibacter TaxID=2617802 RepID=UPI0033983EEE